MIPSAIKRLQPLENVRSACAPPDRRADQAGDPDDRHTIGRTEIAVQQRLSEFRICQAVDQEIQIGRRNEKSDATNRGRVNPAQDGRHVEQVDWHPEHAVDVARKIVDASSPIYRICLDARARHARA